MPRIEVTPEISIDEAELAFSFVRASGPGGQNVNKVETAAQLRFDVANSPSLEPAVKRRLERLAGSRFTKEGVVVIFAQNRRSQEQNRQDALGRLLRLIAAAAERPKPRIKTRPSLSARRQRVESKVRRGETKRLRSGPPE
ncbi:alternative ribosome rescue aminoacyl-tRNA hydrolase ArfB [Methylocapsa aurea]|jgi:ribosome-associated protein|uniref:alternative ribosome rescue aminoacyl-tRNA hydrolase ArfB n=1 Tax=Methylocapsa aurea TaxID=663610 RepID=UPI0005675E35|nr:alternative ribosome rescue aminoacyl-tRNA hydrolase ArfB [Methylocapsa aurea]